MKSSYLKLFNLVLIGCLALFLTSAKPSDSGIVNGLSNRITDTVFTSQELEVLSGEGKYLLYDHLIAKGHRQLNNRTSEVKNALKNIDNVQDYQQGIGEKLTIIQNSFPDKVPLDVKTTGKLKFEKHTLEKVVFQAHPGVYISGNLYIPTFKEGPFPAILEACGHSTLGKAEPKYQSAAISLVHEGFVVLVIDSYSHGERKNLKLPQGVSHTQIDIGAMITGSDIVFYQVWENMRAIDFLTSRPEVLDEKIGMTGNSGGGTQTMYAASLDPRIKVAAISCGLQSRDRMFSWWGLADGCHNYFNEGEKALEYADYLIYSAPKPIMILAAEEDGYFDINAVSKTFREAKRFYKTLGYPDQLDMYTVDDNHGFHKGLREAAVWWFNKWLKGSSHVINEEGLDIQQEADLMTTQNGQVAGAFKNSFSINEYNSQRGRALEQNRKDFREEHTSEEFLKKIKGLIRYTEYNTDGLPDFKELGTIEKNGILLKKIELTSRDGFPLPLLLYTPKKTSTPLMVKIILHDEGKSNVFATDSALASNINGNEIVLALDVRGVGETSVDLLGYGERNIGKARFGHHQQNDQHQIAQTSLYLGETLIGQRTEDVVDAINFLNHKFGIDNQNIELISLGQYGPIALHVAAIDSRINHTLITNSINSYLDILDAPTAKNQFKLVVPGVLQYYDLPDLVDVIGSDKVDIVNPVDAFGILKD